MTMISARDLRFAYASGEFSLSVPDFSADAGETVGIAGPSGTGKTTLLRLLSGILKPDAGRVIVCGKDAAELSARALRELRLRHLGLVFQDFALLDYLTVEDNILLPSRLGGLWNDELPARARELAERLEITQHWKHLTSELSQGERQRVAVARALAHSPQLVLADEPTASLDGKRKMLVVNLLKEYAAEKSAALVVVTHDTEIFAQLERVVDMEGWMS
ncbi:MAG: ABC transporter ATP-binding protein [Verrucomicrobiaceae bacterium]